MELVSRRTFLPFLALILLSAVFFLLLVPTRIHGSEPPFVLYVAAAPTNRLAPEISWVDDLEHRLRTYFTKKYPSYDFAPYAQELERIRSAANRQDRWGVKRETGVYLRMLIRRAHGLGDDAAEELAALSQRVMPDEEFGIVYPGSETGP
jgi:hypothetical protein